jgi:hypothetical protein
MGQEPTGQSFIAIIIGSLPAYYDPQIGAMMGVAKSSPSTSPLTPDTLIEAIQDEYDRRTARSKKLSANDNDDAAYAAGSGSGKRFNGNCFKCGKHGHRGRDCRSSGDSKGNEEGKGKGKQKGKAKSETAAAAKDANSDNEPEGVWLAMVEDANDVSIDDDKDEAFTTTFDHAMLANGHAAKTMRTELYDSGASRHMSSYRDQFVNFKSIVPKPITAADKRTFQAVGKGDMLVHLPNGKTRSPILLKDVLYAPTMGVTLISISRLDAAGCAALFRDSRCRIYNAVNHSID